MIGLLARSDRDRHKVLIRDARRFVGQLTASEESSALASNLQLATLRRFSPPGGLEILTISADFRLDLIGGVGYESP